jgi:hypothetical protein
MQASKKPLAAAKAIPRGVPVEESSVLPNIAGGLAMHIAPPVDKKRAMATAAFNGSPRQMKPRKAAHTQLRAVSAATSPRGVLIHTDKVSVTKLAAQELPARMTHRLSPFAGAGMPWILMSPQIIIALMTLL